MLSEIAPEEMNEVEAFEALEPDPLARIAEILKAGFTVISLYLARGLEIDHKTAPEDFEPGREIDPYLKPRKARPEREETLSPNHQVQLLRGIPGFDP